MGTRRVVRDDSGTLEGRIYERVARGGSCARLASLESLSRGLQLERCVQELPRCLDRCRLDSLTGADNNPCLIGADNDPCSRGSISTPIISPLRAISSFFEPVEGQRAGKDPRMSGKQLMTLEDLNAIWEGYSFPSSIVLSAPTAHETPRDNRLGHLCPNEHMLGAGVRIPFDFGVAEALWAFNVPPACIVPQGRELLIGRSSQGYVEFLARRDVKGIDNPPDSVPGWESGFFFAQLTSKVDIRGIPERWEEPLPDPIPRFRLSLPASQRWALTYFRGTTLRWHSSREEFFHWCESVCFMVAKEGEQRTLKRVRPSEE
ncbi:hypothetical protein ACLOJK_008303 [Asimina triloba]